MYCIFVFSLRFGGGNLCIEIIVNKICCIPNEESLLHLTAISIPILKGELIPTCCCTLYLLKSIKYTMYYEKHGVEHYECTGEGERDKQKCRTLIPHFAVCVLCKLEGSNDIFGRTLSCLCFAVFSHVMSVSPFHITFCLHSFL